MIVDLHSHILPGVDDGAYTMEDALELARMAVQSGVSTLVATPHYRYYGYDNREQILTAFYRLQDQLAYEQIPLKLALGTEIYLKKGRCPQLEAHMCYPKTKWFLAEFPVDERPENMQQMLQEYADAGFWPVIAHPERYLALQEEPILARSWVEKGWGVQLNRDSLLGKLGKRSLACADFLMACGWANLIASDAHWLRLRNTDWSDALDVLFHRYDPRLVKLCLEENPARILRGEALQKIDKP